MTQPLITTDFSLVQKLAAIPLADGNEIYCNYGNQDTKIKLSWVQGDDGKKIRQVSISRSNDLARVWSTWITYYPIELSEDEPTRWIPRLWDFTYILPNNYRGGDKWLITHTLPKAEEMMGE